VTTRSPIAGPGAPAPGAAALLPARGVAVFRSVHPKTIPTLIRRDRLPFDLQTPLGVSPYCKGTADSGHRA
jgi:hypothetical protein